MSDAKIIYGFHAVTSRLRQKAAGVKEIYLDPSRHDRRARDLAQAAQARSVRIMMVDGARLDGMTQHARHQGVAARVETAAPARDIDDVLGALDEPALLLVLDGITDPHNLGACLRVADGAGAHAVVAPKDRAVGLNATVAKVASGAAETVPYLMVTNLARTLGELKERDIWVVGTSDRAERSIYDVDLKRPVALVLGAEGEGMRQLTAKTCDELVRIPMAGAVESLNVSVASGVCLYEALRQRSASGSR